MADINTILRETSVLIGVNDLVNGFDHSYNLDKYSKKYESILNGKYDDIIKKVDSIIDFSQNQKIIIKNGYFLSKKIVEVFKINKIDSLKWIADENSSKVPYDVEINNMLFSLKEDSYILHNMGLSSLVNIYTRSNLSKLHIYEDFAYKEYDEWFKYTYNGLINFLKVNLNGFEYSNRHLKSIIKLINNNVFFEIYHKQNNNKKIIAELDIYKTDINYFNSNTTNKIREYCFAKWINKYYAKNINYKDLKYKASTAAGANIVQYLKNNFIYSDKIFELFRFFDNEYYYAKVINNNVDIYRVPSRNEVISNFKLFSIDFVVPESQINIISKFVNIKNGGIVELRNECRFSHGQFATAPEAKLYFGKNLGPLNLYEKIL